MTRTREAVRLFLNSTESTGAVFVEQEPDRPVKKTFYPSVMSLQGLRSNDPTLLKSRSLSAARLVAPSVQII